MEDTKSLRLRHIFVIMICILRVTSEEVIARGRRSDDRDPLESVVSALSQRVDLLTAQNTALQARLDAVETPVAFTAYFKQHAITGLGNGQILKFDTVLYNAGSGYNPTTGLFTAPSSGTYFFYFTVMRQADDNAMYASLVKGTTALTMTHVCCSTYSATSSAATLHLLQGETIHVQTSAGSVNGESYTTFSGAKLSPL